MLFEANINAFKIRETLEQKRSAIVLYNREQFITALAQGLSSLLLKKYFDRQKAAFARKTESGKPFCRPLYFLYEKKFGLPMKKANFE